MQIFLNSIHADDDCDDFGILDDQNDTAYQGSSIESFDLDIEMAKKILFLL